MDFAEAKKLAQPEYEAKYGWKDIEVTECVANTFGGHLAAVRGPAKVPHEEICYISQGGKVKIFRDTEELVRFIEKKAKLPLFERMIDSPMFLGALFVVVLIAVLILGLFGDESDFGKQAMTILGSVAAAAAGYFFGTAKGR